jgi:hypothetical protein
MAMMIIIKILLLNNLQGERPYHLATAYMAYIPTYTLAIKLNNQTSTRWERCGQETEILDRLAPVTEKL